jgi:hypothetical protein
MGAAITRGMRSFARWASSRPHWLVLLTVLFVHLLAPVATALLVLDALRRGPAAAAISAAVAMLLVVLLGVLTGSGMAETVGLTAPFLVGGAASGALLGWARSLSLAFQGTVVGFIVAVALIFGLVPATNRIGEILQDQWLALFRAGGADAAMLEQLTSLAAGEFVRFLLIALFASLLIGLMLGFWWYALIGENVSFGSEFRRLKLGRIAGIALMVLVVVGQFVDIELIRNLSSLAVVGFLFQGLSVMHARSRSDNWPGAAVAAAYVLLVIPWTMPIALMGLSAIGLLDNVFELRARAAPPE